MTGVESHGDSPEELAQLFKTKVVRRLTLGGERRPAEGRSPRVAFVAGQPASQKSSVEEEVARQLHDPARIDADHWRDLTPMASWEDQDDLTAAELSHPVVSQWVDDAIAFLTAGCGEGRYLDALVSATLKDHQKALAKIESFRNAGYEVYVIFMAVDSLTSRLSIVDRYLRAKENGHEGRYVPTDVHDAAYEGVLQTARQVDEKALGDLSVRVYRRRNGESTVAYRNTLSNGEWAQRPAAAEQMLSQERYCYWEHHVPWFRARGRELLCPTGAPLRDELRRHVAGTMCNLLDSVCLLSMPHH